ncbi:DUF4268 domain-containing protein [Mesorhizobium sp. M0134]|uniref:DUF4268 domain-containing protein n=1 Tax=Mesorhizobium sp. M0134 TaxID=2956889 RepID=UPI00333A8819
MFLIQRTQNRINRLEERRFAELGLNERAHLQEWLANMPAALGEDLLIIQKEFDGFNDTRERLDLLALDKKGQLVIIENKLDDSGRDVVWQAVKYAAYCSSLKTAQITEIYQLYLDRHCGGGNAVECLCEFLEVDDLVDVVLNSRKSQRLIMIAAKFRKEVTATALWFLDHGISTQCFKAIPYSHGAELFLDIRQIIPVPEAEEFMISMSSKDSEERTAQGAQKSRHVIRLAFWDQALDALRHRQVRLFQNISPSQDSWITAGCGISSCHYALIFGKHEARVELSLQRPNADENKWLFDQLYQEREAIERAFGSELTWKRLDDIKASRVQFSKGFDGYNREHWSEITNWMIEKIVPFERAIKAPLQRLALELRSLELDGTTEASDTLSTASEYGFHAN